jgi:hypothetical protein
MNKEYGVNVVNEWAGVGVVDANVKNSAKATMIKQKQLVERLRASQGGVTVQFKSFLSWLIS